MDRNTQRRDFKRLGLLVALRKESVDRNDKISAIRITRETSLSVRRAWIEIQRTSHDCPASKVALRKESVDRNKTLSGLLVGCINVALRKESVDRNTGGPAAAALASKSLSVRRAWIEIYWRQ